MPGGASRMRSAPAGGGGAVSAEGCAPAAPEVANTVYARASRSTKPITLCIIGGATEAAPPSNLTTCGTLQEAAEAALGRRIATYRGKVKKPNARGRLIRGLYCGGTLCS